MDSSAKFVDSLLRPLRSPDGRGIVVGPDQALVGAASLGLSLAVYRLVSALAKGRREGAGVDGNNENKQASVGILSLPTFLLTFLRAALFRKIQDGDAYHRAAYGGNKNRQQVQDLGPEMQHRGSCHCGSIRFTLCAPRNIQALDCGGKIRYPHYPTTADKFQLTKGSRHLKMYYVTVNNVSEDGSPAGTTCMAAHTFCSRCGVNLLRAPDSNMDALEVNVGCLDKDGYTTVNVEYYRADDKVGLGAGAPLPHQWLVDECDEPKPATYEGDEDCTTLDGTHGPIHVDDISTFWPTELESSSPDGGGGPTIEAVESDLMTPPASSSSNSSNHPLMKVHTQHSGGRGREGTLDTPSTSASTMSDVMPLPSRVVVSHQPMLDCQSSIGSTDDLTLSVGGSLGVIGEDGGGWTDRSALPPRPTSLNKDQMKYYMTRHMHSTPSSSSSFNSGNNGTSFNSDNRR